MNNNDINDNNNYKDYNKNENYEDSFEIENPNEIASKHKKTKKNINLENIKQKEEIIFIKQLIPFNYICKIRQKNIKINNLIPKKQRLFITKIINQKKNETKEEDKINIIPISTICYTTKSPIIQGKTKFINSITNNYCFYTKIHLSKDKIKNIKDNIIKGEDKNTNINTVKKFPCKIYRKAIVSPNKKKLGKIKNKNLVNKNNINKYNNIEPNSKKVKKTEKISLISKNRFDPSSSKGEDNKDNKLIVRNNNNINDLNNLNNMNDNNNKDFSDEDLERNRIDISIQFSNTPININYNNNENEPNKIKTYKNNTNFKNNKNRLKFHSSNKKNKNITDSLYKDLKEINNKLENRNHYLKNHYHLDYPMHMGKEENCPICIEVRKKGREMEKEKGLFSAFSFRNYKKVNRKTLNRLKLSNLKKNQSVKKLDLLSDEERRKNNLFNLNNLNNLSQNNFGFHKKYMEFNGMNRLHKFNRYGSVGNISNKNSRNDFNNNNQIINDGRIFEKSDDIFNNSEYPLLKNYFHNNDYKTNNYFN